MEQGIAFDTRREVVGCAAVEKHVADVESGRTCGAARKLEFLRRQYQGRACQGHHQHDEECGKKPARTPRIESAQLDPGRAAILCRQESRNQISRENEKHVDADEAAGTPRDAAVTPDNE